MGVVPSSFPVPPPREVDMAKINPNPQTPKPNVRPVAIPRARIVEVEHDGMLVRGTVEDLRAMGYGVGPAPAEAQQPPRRISRVGTNENQRPAGEPPIERIRPISGDRCSHCGDELPEGARFCIVCGRSVEHTGPTRKL